MSVNIHVNPEELTKQINILNELSKSTELKDKISQVIDIYSESSGETAEVIKEINLELIELSEKMQLLFQVTTDFLSNTNSNFVEADNNVAKAIENATLPNLAGKE